jgi:hypothetical protein
MIACLPSISCELESTTMPRALVPTAILPCNDLDASKYFNRRLGFTQRSGPDDFRMPSDGRIRWATALSTCPETDHGNV